MPVTETPSPAPKANTDKTKAGSKTADTQTEAFKGAFDDAQSAVTDAWGDVKSLTEAGKPCNLVVLTAAIDDLTAAIGDLTAHGSRFAPLPEDESKALRDAHSKLTQAYSDLRTIVEFGAAADSASAIANMDAAVSGVADATA